MRRRPAPPPPGAPEAPEADDHAPMSLGTRVLLFGLVLAAAMGLVLLLGGEHAHVARHFLSNLLRRMF